MIVKFPALPEDSDSPMSSLMRAHLNSGAPTGVCLFGFAMPVQRGASGAFTKPRSGMAEWLMNDAELTEHRAAGASILAGNNTVH